MPRPRRYNDVAEDEAKLSQFVQEAKAIADAKKAISDADLGATSAVPLRYLGGASAVSRQHLGDTSAIPRPRRCLGGISATPRRYLGGASAIPRRYLGATSATSPQVVSDADLESLLGVVMDQAVQGEGTSVDTSLALHRPFLSLSQAVQEKAWELLSCSVQSNSENHGHKVAVMYK